VAGVVGVLLLLLLSVAAVLVVVVLAEGWIKHTYIQIHIHI
jgi:hypothetical protein